jgi:hypothetical protein
MAADVLMLIENDVCGCWAIMGAKNNHQTA